MANINWGVFTQEERQEIQKLIDAGKVTDIACVITNINIDLEKEVEMQNIIDNYTPDDEDFVSEIDDAEFHEKIANIDKTPEKEAEFQKKLDDERASFVEKKKAKKKKSVKEEKKEEVSDIALTLESSADEIVSSIEVSKKK